MLAPMPSVARSHDDDARARRRKHVLEHRVPRPDDRHDVVERGHQVHRGCGADRRSGAHAVRGRGNAREQLAAAEARTFAGCQEDADDAHVP